MKTYLYNSFSNTRKKNENLFTISFGKEKDYTMCDDCLDLEERYKVRMERDIFEVKARIYKQIVEQTLGINIEDQYTVENLFEKKHRSLKSPAKKKRLSPPPLADADDVCSIDGGEAIQPKVVVEKNIIPEVSSENVSFKAAAISDVSNSNLDEKELFTALKDARQYTPILDTLKKMRAKNRETTDTSYDQSIETIKRHLNKMTFIFQGKAWPLKKVNQILCKAFTPLEHFLSQRPGYERDSNVEVDELASFRLFISRLSTKEYLEVFDSEQAYSFFTKPYIAFYSLEDLIKMLVQGYKTIIYVQTTGEDDYSFYVFDGVKSNDQSKWKMDCRLEKLTTDLQDTIRNYCISLFRSIYFACMNTNRYVSDYIKQVPYVVLDSPCEQILETFYHAIDFLKLNRTLRDIVKKYCTLESKEEDLHSFNFLTDDSDVKAHFEDLKPVSRDLIIEETKMLFDNMSTEDVLLFKRF
jgi:hypothetical protein